MKKKTLFLFVSLAAVIIFITCRLSFGSNGEEGRIPRAIASGKIIEEASKKIGITAFQSAGGGSISQDRHRYTLQFTVMAPPEKFETLMRVTREEIRTLITESGARIYGKGTAENQEKIRKFSYSYKSGRRDGFVDALSNKQGDEAYLLTFFTYEHD